MMYDGVINKPPLDELYHFNKNHDPNNGQFTSGVGVDNSAKTLKKNEYVTDSLGYFKSKIKGDSGKEIQVSGHWNKDFKENDADELLQSFSKNKKEITKKVLDTIVNDNSEYNVYESFAKPLGISKDEMRKNLDIHNIHLYDKDGTSEFSVWEKDGSKYDLTGGHSLDVEVNLRNGKVSKYYSMNG